MLRFKVSGMTCDHCRQTVEQSVRAVALTARVAADLGNGEVTLDGQADPVKVQNAIVDAGYDAVRLAA
jgi:copper chaperone